MNKIIFFLLCTSCFSQNSRISFILNSQKADKDITNEVDSILKNVEERGEVYYEEVLLYSNWLSNNKKATKAIALLEKEVISIDRKSEGNLLPIQALIYKLGELYGMSGSYQKAIRTFKNIILQGPHAELHYKVYTGMAICFLYTNDYYKAISYFKQAITRPKNKNHPIDEHTQKVEIVKNAINISKAYNKLGGVDHIEEGRKYLFTAEAISKSIPYSYKRRFGLNMALFSTYNFDETLNIDKGLFYLNKALLLAKKERDSFGMYTAILKKGNLYNTTAYDKALYYHNESIKYASKKDRVKIQYYYGNLAYLYLQKKEFIKSEYYANERVKYLSGKNINQLLHRTNNSVIQNTQDKERLYKFLDYYAQAITANPAYKNDALKSTEIIKTYYLIDVVIDQIQKSCTENKSRLYWREKAASFYSKAIKACYKVNDVNSAFYFLEKNKAQLLLQDVLHNEYKQQLPEHVIVKENELKKAVLNATNSFSSKTNPVLQTEQQQRVFNSKLHYQQYKDSVAQHYPISTVNKNKIKLISLKEVQQKLATNEVFVSYFWYTNKQYVGNEKLEGVFCLIASPSVTNFIEISDIKSVEKLVSAYKNKVSQPFNTIQDREVFNTISYELYKMLFPTKEIRDLLQHKKLLIASDSQLQNIPFEALITNKKTNSYLINSSEVSYVYSMSFLKKNKGVKRNATHNFVGYSPENFSYTALDSLSQTTREIRTVQNSIGGDVYCKEQALKESFLKDSKQYKIIHLATHANASENPWIAFNDSKLEAHELYTYKNEADLVVLSACNTATGELVKGEGVMSLARGFFHSGANTVVSTLWSVNDKSTAGIMKDFYQKLSDGETKSRALHLAKRKYIATSSLSDASPYYWASFILIGDSGEVSLKNNNCYWRIIGILFCFFFGNYIYKRKKLI